MYLMHSHIAIRHLLSGVVSFVPYTIANQPNLAHSGSYGLLGQRLSSTMNLTK